MITTAQALSMLTKDQLIALLLMGLPTDVPDSEPKGVRDAAVHQTRIRRYEAMQKAKRGAKAKAAPKKKAAPRKHIERAPRAPSVETQKARANIVRLIEKRKSLSVSELADELGLTNSYAAAQLKALIQTGTLGKTGVARWTKYYVVRPNGAAPEAEA